MLAFDLTKTDSIEEICSTLEDQHVEDIIVFAECVFG